MIQLLAVATETALERYVLNGGVMMVFLIPLALLAVAFIVQGFINLRSARISPPGFSVRLAEVLGACRSRAEIETALEGEGHSLAMILRRVLRHLEFKGDADPADLLDQAIAEECDALQQRNSQLAVIYNVAPLMGLLGTVFGMIQTFRNFTESPDPSVRELSEGINIALLTTAWGLAIAIPAFVFLYFFTRRIDSYEQVELRREGQESLETLLQAVGRIGKSSPAPPKSDAGEEA